MDFPINWLLTHKKRVFFVLLLLQEENYNDFVTFRIVTVKPVYYVRGQFAAFLAFKAENQRPIIILLFETLQFRFLWNFCGINQFWATAPMDLKNQLRTKKIAKKSIFQAQFWSASNQYISMKFYMAIAICLNLNLWINKNFACSLHGHEKWAYFYVMEAKNGHFSVFSSCCKIDWNNFLSRSHQKKIMILDHNLWKFHQNLIKLLLNKILWRFR